MPPLAPEDAARLIAREHPEWYEHQRSWRWLLDTYEGGKRYKYANYFIDPRAVGAPALWYHLAADGSLPGGYELDPQTGKPYTIAYGNTIDTNLIPHLGELGVDGRHLYAMRLERTPIPSTLRLRINTHMARIFGKEVQRTSPDERVTAWWADVDGRGTTMDSWMRQVVGPLLLVLGQVDVVCDHPPAPAGTTIVTAADARRYGLDRCVADVILPENLVWWRLEPGGRRYAEALVFVRCEGPPHAYWRHWTLDESNAYDLRGEPIPELSRTHRFGICPIVRLYDRRKLRCAAVGQPRYEYVAEIQRAIYNLQSELTLGDVEHSHPTLQGPEDFLSGDSQIPVGIGNILPKKKNLQGGITTYEAWGYLDPPKGAQQEIRQHILDLIDEADREFAMLKPAGATTRGTVAQSGISKVMDSVEGNDRLSEEAETFAEAEKPLAELALHVLYDGPPAPVAVARVTVVYPREFGLQTPQDLADGAQQVQDIMAGAPVLPEATRDFAKRSVAMNLPGMADDRMAELHEEIDEQVDALALRHQQALEAAPARVAGDEADAESVAAEELGVGAGGAWGAPS